MTWMRLSARTVEGLIHQATCVTGIRRARYLGLGKTRLEHLAAATAINLIRLYAWYGLKPEIGPEPLSHGHGHPIDEQLHCDGYIA